MTGELFAIIAPVFLGAAVGYAWAKSGQPFDTTLVTQLLTLVTTPCLVFSQMSTLTVSTTSFGIVALATAAALVIFGIAGFVALKALRIPLETGWSSILLPNCGNMGLALSLFAFGDAGLEYGLSFYVVASTATFALAPWIASGAFSARRLLTAPLIYATAISVTVLLTETAVPQWLLNTTTLLGQVTIPLMIITLGVSLARLQVKNMRSSTIIAMLRLLIGFGTGLAIAWAFGLTGVPRGVMILMCAMPPAVINYLFAQKYGKNAEEVSGAVVISSAVSFLALP
ncbi:MAG: AEC family transporter, partial [Proteobacteria bacterium]|nr:AEC family transporter [Pseudomonadota bacterium]